jgi:hypothetical protein
LTQHHRDRLQILHEYLDDLIWPVTEPVMLVRLIFNGGYNDM